MASSRKPVSAAGGEQRAASSGSAASSASRDAPPQARAKHPASVLLEPEPAQSSTAPPSSSLQQRRPLNAQQPPVRPASRSGPPAPPVQVNDDNWAYAYLAGVAVLTLLALWLSIPAPHQWSPPVDHDAAFVGWRWQLPAPRLPGLLLSAGPLLPAGQAIDSAVRQALATAPAATPPLVALMVQPETALEDLLLTYLEQAPLAPPHSSPSLPAPAPLSFGPSGNFSVLLWLNAPSRAVLCAELAQLAHHLALRPLSQSCDDVRTVVLAWLYKQARPALLLFDLRGLDGASAPAATEAPPSTADGSDGASSKSKKKKPKAGLAWGVRAIASAFVPRGPAAVTLLLTLANQNSTEGEEEQVGYQVWPVQMPELTRPAWVGALVRGAGGGADLSQAHNTQLTQLLSLYGDAAPPLCPATWLALLSLQQQQHLTPEKGPALEQVLLAVSRQVGLSGRALLLLIALLTLHSPAGVSREFLQAWAEQPPPSRAASGLCFSSSQLQSHLHYLTQARLVDIRPAIGEGQLLPPARESVRMDYCLAQRLTHLASRAERAELGWRLLEVLGSERSLSTQRGLQLGLKPPITSQASMLPSNMPLKRQLEPSNLAQFGAAGGFLAAVTAAATQLPLAPWLVGQPDMSVKASYGAALTHLALNRTLLAQSLLGAAKYAMYQAQDAALAVKLLRHASYLYTHDLPARTLEVQQRAAKRRPGQAPADQQQHFEDISWTLQVLQSLHHLGEALSLRGRSQAALNQHDKAAGLVRSLFGERHSLMAECLVFQGDVKLAEQQPQSAHELYKQALELDRAVHAAAHNTTTQHTSSSLALGRDWQRVAAALDQQGNTQAAVEALEQQLQALQSVLGDGNAQLATAQIKEDMGRLLWRRTNALSHSAMKLLRAAHETWKRQLDSLHPRLGASSALLGQLFQRQGWARQAKRELTEAMSCLEEASSLFQPSSLELLSRLAASLNTLGFYEEGTQRIEQALLVASKLYGPDAPETQEYVAKVEMQQELVRQYQREKERRKEMERKAREAAREADKEFRRAQKS